MKKFITLTAIVILIFNLSIYAQSPEKFNYQAVVRDQSGNVISEKAVSLRISILKGSTFGTYVFVENHSPKTNKFGVVNLIIGDGTLSTGSLSDIDWSDGPYFIKIDIDATGGENYSELGTVQLISVPYSLYSNKSDLSKTSENVINVDYDQLTNKPDLGIYQIINATGTWDKVSDDDVNLTGDQIIEGKKTFNKSLTVNNKLKASIDNSDDTTIVSINRDETGPAIAIIGLTESHIGTAIKGVSPYTGVYGLSSSSDAAGTGVYGSSNSGTGSGVYGYNSKADGKGVYGLSGATSGEGFGVYGRSYSPEGYGVYGANGYGGGIGIYGYSHNLSGLGCGIKGESKSMTGIGVYGIASSTSGNNIGVRGITESSTGSAIYGTALSFGGVNYGVRGISQSSTGVGVLGATTSTTGTNYGVRGYSASSDGYDFYAVGAGVNYGAPSSSRWKTDIITMTDVLNKVKKLEGVYFTWDAEHGGDHDLGFIGEEVAEYFPEVVGKDPEAPGFVTGMDYGKMTPILLQAINEQQVIIENQQKQIDDLRKRLETLESK